MLSCVDVEDAVESFFDTDCQILLLLSLRYNIYKLSLFDLRMITIHRKFTLDVRNMNSQIKFHSLNEHEENVAY